MILAAHDDLAVKTIGCRRKIRSIEGDGIVDFVPHQPDRVDDIGGGVRFREHIADLLQRIDIPLRHIVFEHRLDHILRNRNPLFILPHELHDLERQTLFHVILMDEGHHNVVTTPDYVGNRADFVVDQILRVAKPASRTMRQTGNLE